MSSTKVCLHARFDNIFFFFDEKNYKNVHFYHMRTVAHVRVRMGMEACLHHSSRFDHLVGPGRSLPERLMGISMMMHIILVIL